MSVAITPQTTIPGKRLFVAGCIVLIVFSTVHMIPMFIDLFGEPSKQAEIAAKQAMSEVAVDIGPIRTNWTKLNQLLSTSYSTLLYFVAAINLVSLRPVIEFGRLRTLATLNAIFCGILLAIAVIFHFPPPGVFSMTALVLFACAAIKSAPHG